MTHERQKTRRAVVAAAALAAVAGVMLCAAFACEPDRPVCYFGDYQECNCANLAVGYEGCRQTQDGYFACVCTGVAPTEPLAFGPGAFLATCTKGSDCQGGYCSRGRCTMPCSADSDCPPAAPAPITPADAGDASDDAADASDDAADASDDAGDDGGDAGENDAGPAHACTDQGLCRTVSE